MNFNLNLQSFYECCRNEIISNLDMLGSVLEKINNCDCYESKGQTIIIKSWLNTVDSLDISMLLSETAELIDELTKQNDLILYLTIITELTIILNNIFYSKNRSYKVYWVNNVYNLYFGIICNFERAKMTFNNDEIKKYLTGNIDINEFYHSFFTAFQDRCLRLGITVDLEEYFL